MTEKANALGLGGVTIFTGYRQDVRAVMGAFDLYVNCSTYEGVSLTILEAMATALPVIASSVGGNPEVIIDHETGLLIQGHPHALATAIASLAADPARRHTMGEAGRWRVKRHFSIERMVNDYAAAYRVPRKTANKAEPRAPPNAPNDCDARPASPIG